MPYNPKNLANLKPFKPGHSGNPAGRLGVLPPEIRAERKRNQAGLITMITAMFSATDACIKTQLLRPEATQLEKAVHGLIKTARGGDVTAFKYLIELMVGKIPENDYDGFTEEDIRILNRVKEVFNEQQQPPQPVGNGH